MASLSLQSQSLLRSIEAARLSGSAWTVRLEYVGRMTSAKFWTAEGVGDGPVKTFWGPIGRVQGTMTRPFNEALRRVKEKLREGYNVASWKQGDETGRGGKTTRSTIGEFMEKIGAKPFGTSAYMGVIGKEDHARRPTTGKPSLAALLQSARKGGRNLGSRNDGAQAALNAMDEGVGDDMVELARQWGRPAPKDVIDFAALLLEEAGNLSGSGVREDERQGARYRRHAASLLGNATYVTTFCNFAHRIVDGKPIGHECYVIDPRLISSEAAWGTWSEQVRNRWARTRKTHRGVRGSRTDVPHSYSVSYTATTEESLENNDADDVGFYDGRGGRYSVRRYPKSVKTEKQKRAYLDEAHKASTYTFDPADVDEDTSYVDLMVKVLQRAGASAFDPQRPGDNYTTSADENFRTGEKVYYEYKLDGFSPEELHEIHRRIKGR